MLHFQVVTYMQIIRLKNSQKCCRNFAPATRDRETVSKIAKRYLTIETIRNGLWGFSLCAVDVFLDYTDTIRIESGFNIPNGAIKDIAKEDNRNRVQSDPIINTMQANVFADARTDWRKSLEDGGRRWRINKPLCPIIVVRRIVTWIVGIAVGTLGRIRYGDMTESMRRINEDGAYRLRCTPYRKLATQIARYLLII